ncbi:MAG: galactonate dehydratase [Gammaproteobacteria bacterium]|jgi:galactonate dehydratase
MTDTIATITPYIIPAEPAGHQWWARKAYILVRVETAEGIVGWGECHILSFRENAIVAMVNRLAQWFEGHPSDNIRGLLHNAFGKFGQQRPGVEVYSAFSGIEIALWDILGKRLDAPVYRLLGGTCHEKLPIYANIYTPNTHPPEAYADIASRMVADGHTVIKLYPFSAETSVNDGIAILKAVYDAVGSEVGLAVDLWGHATPARALMLARAMEPFNLLWIEDPFTATDAANLRYLRDSIKQPLLTGETLPTRREFSDLFDRRAVDIINPDICLSGIVEIQAIAAMAEPANITVALHNSNSMALGTSAAIHAGAGIPNLGPIEYFPLFETALDDVCSGRPLVESGEVSMPETPGLGVVFDETAMARFRV